jgi:hypothetical protein
MKVQTKIESIPDNQINWDLEVKRIEVQEHIQNISERKRYANRVFIFVISWLIAAIAILILNGLRILHLSDTILSVLIGTTTLDIFGFFYLVMRYLFENKKR